MSFEKCIEYVFHDEGGLNLSAGEPGGGSNMGVSLTVLREFRKNQDLTLDDLSKLTPEEAGQIYRKIYWVPDLPEGIDYAIFDIAINSGLSVAKRIWSIWSAASTGLGLSPQTSIRAICDMRLNYMRTRDTWEKNGKGWTARVNRVIARAEGMIDASV